MVKLRATYAKKCLSQVKMILKSMPVFHVLNYFKNALNILNCKLVYSNITEWLMLMNSRIEKYQFNQSRIKSNTNCSNFEIKSTFLICKILVSPVYDFWLTTVSLLNTTYSHQRSTRRNPVIQHCLGGKRGPWGPKVLSTR